MLYNDVTKRWFMELNKNPRHRLRPLNGNEVLGAEARVEARALKNLHPW